MILLCSSRGALLALIIAGISFVVLASGAARKQAVYGLGLAGLTVFVLAGDPEILSRFLTTFTSAEERDGSAATRLVYWGAGFRMLSDHPLGAGGDGYTRGYASDYLADDGIDAGARSVHNGILNEALEWGLQGWVLRMLFIGMAVTMTRRTLKQQAALGRTAEAAMGCCLVASTVAFVCSSAFGDYLDDEWGYWMPALMVAYARLYGAGAQEVAPGLPAATTAASVVRRPAIRRPAAAQRT
ncbi:MAG: O-antigen ligase family protein [Dehalococcoidia bacterium]